MLFNIIKGNFCPDDIQNLKKRLKKRIDTSFHRSVL